MRSRISKMFDSFNRALHFVRNDIWRMPLKELPRRKMFLIKQLRILILAVRGFREDQVLLRAPALTYYSMFSIVPVAALAFGIAKGFGLEMYVERQLQSALAGREEVFNWVMEITQSFLRGTHGGTVALVGLFILIYTITMLLLNIETSFNEIWQVSKSRPLARKFSDYFAMMFIAPLFFIMASAATVYLNTQIQEADYALLNPLLVFLVNLIPYVLIWMIFTILYMVMPYTNVKFYAALPAGIIAGTLFQLIQWSYITFQIGAARYGAIYGSFAALPLLLLWMQVSWIVVLFGAELSFANQHVDNYEFEAETKHISPFNKRILALYILHLLVHRFQQGLKPVASDDISNILYIPNSLVRIILNELEDIGMVSQVDISNSKRSAYQPALDINMISIKTVLEKLDHHGMDVLIAKPSPILDQLKEALSSFHRHIGESEENKLLKDI
jgi:membrane protein